MSNDGIVTLGGVTSNLKRTPSGGVGSSDFYAEVAMGHIPGYSVINKFGHNPVITTASDPEDVWGGGGIYDFYPTTAKAMEILSTSTDDAAAGTGAQTVTVYGLDNNWQEISETVTLNATTAVSLTSSYIRMYRAVVMTAGSDETNVGNLSVRIASATTVGAYIIAGDGQTQQAIYTIPADKTGYFVKGYVGISDSGNVANESALFKWKARPNNGVNGAWQTKGQIECLTNANSWWQYEYGIPAGPLPEKTDIRIECTTVTNTFGVVGGFDLLLKDN